MATPSLQDGIDNAGSPIALLWKPGAAPWTPEVVEREYAGWRREQAAWHEGVALLNLSHHMYDLWIEGPDATRLLADHGANNFEKFAVGQAKQYVPVTKDGNIVTDGILAREAENRYLLSGIPAAQHWVQYHAEKGGYDVSFVTDPSSAYRRGGGDPVLFRYQVQGPFAQDLVERAFGGPLPETKFFHSTPVALDGRRFRALRHGMAGQAGFEFIGPWEHAAPVHEAFIEAGEPLGLVQVGALAYTTPNVESGWIPSPVPAIYSDPDLLEYRKHLPLYGIEGQRPLNGSYFSTDIEDYYCSPYELGYGRMISFNHDFLGRDALAKAKDAVRRTKVTLLFDAGDVLDVIGRGRDPGFRLTYARHRVESATGLVGVTMQTASIDPVGTLLSLALVDKEYAEPGTQVRVVWGEHPGSGTDPEADLGFPRVRATVHPVPFNLHARTLYRRNA
ncbi:aminomethyl transferase family protein [Streptomyces sp. NBC_00878]|uniref:aminomethyl transferase family protein n=1 Tax=Streptomyces sp. NBC_00878 TaxID=2975854 RepID=UPI00224FD534|nr:aminomethyl transferase family protein [Streptomyces sp. NBC_00878]MCX4911037.1 aminomethyl transferase family protein [Streptomyces sp. NBC_00878]